MIASCGTAFWNCESVMMIFARVDVGGVDAPLAKGGGDNAAGDALAVADDEVGDARGEFENGGQAAQNFVEGVEFLVDEVDERGGSAGFLTSAQAVSRWRERSRELMASAPVRSPWRRRRRRAAAGR